MACLLSECPDNIFSFSFGRDDTDLTNSDFYEWNPAVGNDCSSLWPGYYYCVGVSGSVTTIGKRSVAAPTL